MANYRSEIHERRLMESQDVRMVRYDENFLNESWNWFQDRELRKLTMTPAFSREEQLDWYRKLAERQDYLIYGIEIDGKPVGAFGIKNFSDGNAEYWGYIGVRQYWGCGIGKWMVGQAIDLARTRGLRRLWLKVMDENIRAIKLYLGCGFKYCQHQEEVSYMEIIL